MHSIYVICTFSGLEQKTFYIDYYYSDELPINNTEMISDVFDKLDKKEIKGLTKVNCTPTPKTVSYASLNILKFLSNRQGNYLFNYHINEDDDTLRWHKFRQDYLKGERPKPATEEIF